MGCPDQSHLPGLLPGGLISAFDGLALVRPTACDRVNPGIDDHPEGVAPLLDPAALTALIVRISHERMAPRIQSGTRRSTFGILKTAPLLIKQGRAGGT